MEHPPNYGANDIYKTDKGISDHVWDFLKPVIVEIHRGIDAVARSAKEERLLRANEDILRQEAVRRERKTPWRIFESEEVLRKTFDRRARYGGAMGSSERIDYDGLNLQRDAVATYLNKAKFLALHGIDKSYGNPPSFQSECIEALGNIVEPADPEGRARSLLDESKVGIELEEVQNELTRKFAEFLAKSASIGKQEAYEYRARLRTIEEKLVLLAKQGHVPEYTLSRNDGEADVFQRIHALEDAVDLPDLPRTETPPPRPDRRLHDASTPQTSVLESLAEIYYDINNDIHELESRTVPLQAPKERSFAERTSTILKAFTNPRPSGSGSGMNWNAGIGQAKKEWAAAKTDLFPDIKKAIKVDLDRIERIAGRAGFLYSQKPPASTDPPTVSVTSPAETKYSESALEDRGLDAGSPRAENPPYFPFGDPSVTKVKNLVKPTDPHQGYKL
ncbi:MAG TPA: hypothetical protein VGZ00_11535 [Candidatus Baltobacteraceae bacterium]|jgi:hypothetical protein|nr:hypothetical protein [Candidatus Baltobacteraceae bacterium]